MHGRTRREFSIEVLWGFFSPSHESLFIIGDENQPIPIVRNRREKIERRITMAFGQHTAEVGIALWCFSQQERAVVVDRQLSAKNRPQALLLRLLDESDRSIQSIRIGQSYCRHTLSLCRDTKFFQRRHTAHR